MKITREKFKTYKNVFDNWTERNLFKLSSQGYFEKLIGPISIGKEANVFKAIDKEGNPVAVKIYRLENCDFNRMYDYIKYDPRYLSLKKNKRTIIFSWAHREYRNLLQAREIGLNVPTPRTCRDNIVIMDYIGDKEAAPMLKDQEPKNPSEFLKKVIDNVKKYYKGGFVHGDLSSFNILNYKETPVLIDFSQATPTTNQNAKELLERDIKNIIHYFKKIGLKEQSEDILKNILKKK